MPLARRCGRSISLTQRIGWGYAVATLAMLVAGVVEVCRLHIVKENGLQEVDYSVHPVPLSIWWQVGGAV